MKVLVLGATGYIGSRLCTMLEAGGWAEVVRASRHGTPSGVRLDTCDATALTQALRGVDAVVNCVAGDAHAIAGGAEVLAKAAIAAGCLRIVHLSSMSVYGPQQGELTEGAPVDPSLGWYGRAKCDAERHIQAFSEAGGTAVIFRPGCVWGPGSTQWVDRIAGWLRAGRLGDLGDAGDGWSNLVHVDDVCRSIMAALRMPLPTRTTRTFNLAAPDSPRWNDVFVDLAIAIGATPVRRVKPLQVALDARLGGPPLQIARKVLARMGRQPRRFPDPLTRGLLDLWKRHLRLDSGAAERQLQLAWTPYGAALNESAAWYLREVNGGA